MFIANLCHLIGRAFDGEKSSIGLLLIGALVIKFMVSVITRKKIIDHFKQTGIPCADDSIWGGNFNRFKDKTIHDELAKMYQELGPLYSYFIADQPFVIVCDARLTKQIFIGHQDLTKRMQLPISENPISDSILFSSGSIWRRQRKLIQPIFSRYRIEEKEAAAHLDETVDLMLSYLRGREEQFGGAAFQVDISRLMKSTTYHLIGSLALNMKDLGIGESEAYVEQFDNYIDMIAKHDGLIEWVIKIPFLTSLIELITKYITKGPFMEKLFKQVNERMDEPDGGGEKEDHGKRVPLLDALIKLHKEGGLSRKEVQGNAVAILLAGYDTTSTTLAYLWWAMARHEDIQESLHLDVLRLGVNSDYLEAVIYETTRMFSALPTFVSRYLERPITIDTREVLHVDRGKITLPAGCTVVHNAMLQNRDPRLWTEPEKFNPNRFMDTIGGSKKKVPEFFGPFGYGQRKCLGQQLAMTEMKVIVVSTMLRYRLGLVAPQQLTLATHATFLSKPKDTIILTFHPRSQ